MLIDPSQYIAVPAAFGYGQNELKDETYVACVQLFGWLWVTRRHGRPLKTTVAELAERWGVGERAVYRRLRDIADSGWLSIDYHDSQLAIGYGPRLPEQPAGHNDKPREATEYNRPREAAGNNTTAPGVTCPGRREWERSGGPREAVNDNTAAPGVTCPGRREWERSEGPREPVDWSESTSRALEAESSDRVVHSPRREAGPRDRVMHSSACKIGSSDRVMHSSACKTGSSDRLDHSPAWETGPSDRVVHSPGWEAGSSDRVDHSSGWEDEPSDRVDHSAAYETDYNIVVVVDDLDPMLSEEIDQQQQQHIIDLLVAADVFPDTAAALAADPWVTPTRISRWLADLTAKRQEGIVRCVGAVLASNLRRHREPPRPPDEEDRRRYISGEYADYIEH